MTSSGHVTSSEPCSVDMPWAIGCPFGPSCYLASFPRYLSPNLRQRRLRNDVINDVISTGSTISEDHIPVGKIMTSLFGHVTSSEPCPIDDRLSASSYRLSIGSTTLSGLFEIFSLKGVTMIITWWRHQWRHKTRIDYPWGPYRHTIYGNIVLKYRTIRTRIAGEAF